MLALPATALATSLDTASTTKFVAASSQAVSAALAKQSQEKAAANALISHVQSTCPGAVPANLANGTEAQRHTWQAFSGEAVAEFALALTGPIRPAEQRAVRGIAPLRWTSATVNKEVAAFVRQGRATLALHPPDICDQAKAAAASGFAVVPPATATFIKRYSVAAPASAPTVVDLADKMKPLGPSGGQRDLATRRTRIPALTRPESLHVLRDRQTEPSAVLISDRRNSSNGPLT